MSMIFYEPLLSSQINVEPKITLSQRP